MPCSSTHDQMDQYHNDKKFTYRLETGVAPLVDSSDGGLGTLAMIRYDGHIQLHVPAILSISCILDMTMYPFDIQRCNLKFGESNNIPVLISSFN